MQHGALSRNYPLTARRAQRCAYLHIRIWRSKQASGSAFLSAHPAMRPVDAILGRGIGTLLPLNHASTHASLIVYTDRGHHRRNRPGPRPTWASKVGDAPAEAEIEGDDHGRPPYRQSRGGVAMSATIDLTELKARISLKGLTEGHGVKLKRSGRDWKGLCPFHHEKTPSFTVYQDGTDFTASAATRTAMRSILRWWPKDIGFIEACDRLAVGASLQSAKRTNGAHGAHHAQPDWRPIVPPPADAPRPTDEQLRCDMLHE